ncbi:arginine--tRNA ligase [Synechococcus lacustris]|uniref:arginine--tRNA ligase n=1 Tax=Synechococcus lacustris TaxID=2116544 RepID=UPI0020CBFFC1|nr:arginine--tRNA ligase [Synechococcus lacustris]MCP9795604.1 arginine--tRNA ligase [Synechococcus lacustris L1F-Slac]MCP9814550.1 arginine--tRNA ligase [Synechococcus lacustris L1E-Slac]
MLQIAHSLQQQLKAAIARAFPQAAADGEELDPALGPASKPEFGDFQANGALGLAKRLGKPPRLIAEAIAAQIQLDDTFKQLCEPVQIAGPGFLNLTLKAEVLAAELHGRLEDPRLGVEKVINDINNSATIIVDFSSPNIAKEMHVGHLRSTIIGDCIARVLEFRGYRVLRLNHVGDWGTQFGMLISQLKQVAPEALNTADAIDLGDLVTFYREAKQRFDNDSEFQTISREEVVKLQAGDPVSLKAWGLLCEQSRKEFQKIYDTLDINLQERGESFYNPKLQDVVDDLNRQGLLVTDDGARCVFLEGMLGKEGKPLPLIVQKSDGGFNYATTDLAAIRYRLGADGDAATRVIYVTDAGQANHFSAVFQVAKRAGWIPAEATVEHVPFGLVQGVDGKKLKTRSGDTIRLKDLLEEAIEHCGTNLRNRLKEEDRNESEDFIQHVATTVGIAAVKYADLSTNRITNYQFSFERMLALNGNTAPYLLYAAVRIKGIARKGGSLDGATPDKLIFTEPQEWALARQLLQLDVIISDVETELLPNRLCNYLFELSQSFNRFYDQVPVLKAEEPARSSRLALCNLCANTLELGLQLLGIQTLERM